MFYDKSLSDPHSFIGSSLMEPFTLHIERISQLISPVTFHLDAIRILVIVILGYLAYVIAYGLFFCPTRHLPGPFVSKFSYAYYYYILFGGSISRDIAALHRKYGPVVRFAPHRVDVQQAEIARDAWGGHNESKLPWDKDPTLCRMLRFGLKGDNLVSIQNAREGLRMRRLMGPPFARKFLLDQENIFKDCTKRMIDGVNRLRVMNDNLVDMAIEFKKYTLDVMTEFAYGGFFKGASSSIYGGDSEIDLVARVVITLDGLFPTLLKFLKSIPWKGMDWIHARDQLIQISDASIREYKLNVKAGSRKDTLSTLIAAEDSDGKGLSHEELVSAGLVLLAGGIDTTAVALTFITYLLAKHPEYVEKITKELSEYESVDDVKLTDLEKLPFLNAVIREGLRMYPPTGGPFGRLCPPQGLNIGGYHIPGGIIVCHEAVAICRDPNLFPSPDTFKPERWIGLSREEEARLWDHSMIFSYGPRICIGKEMALMAIRMCVSAMAMNYLPWTGIPDKPGKWDDEMKPFDTMIIHPKNEKCMVRLKARVGSESV